MSRDSAPQVSVVIPVRDGAAFIAQAIESVFAQHGAACEIIVVDDGSSDQSAEIARGFGQVRVIATAPQGQSAARNTGAEAACGPYLAFLDADDLWAENRLAAQLKALRDGPGVEIVFAHALMFREIGAHGRPVPVGAPIPAHLPGAMLLRRDTFARVGPYSGAHAVGEPLEWYARAVDLGLGIVTLPDVLLYRRLHPDNLGRRVQDKGTAYARVLRDILARRRANSGEA